MITYQAIKKNAEIFADKTAIKEEDIIISWKDYKFLVKNVICNINDKFALKSINRVMIISENRWELLILYSVLATFKIPYTGVDYSSTEEQKLHCFHSLNPDLVICSDLFSQDIKNLNNTPLINIDRDFKMFSKSVEQEDVVFEELLNIDKKFEAFAFTSGTSGFPKVVYRNESFSKRRMKKLIELYNFNSDDVFLVTVPFYHVSIAGWLGLFMNLGCTAVLSDFNNVKNIYEKLQSEQITTSLIVPPVLTKLLNYMEDKDKTNYLKFVIVGGKNFPASIKQKAISFLGPVINEYYGSTETGINVLADSNLMIKEPYSSGKVMEGSCLVVLNENNEPLPYGKVGRIAINSYQNAHSYLEHNLNQVTLYGKKYIITADNGYFDEFGNLYVVCRADLMETVVDFNLYKVENLLRLIAGVEDVFICTKKVKNHPIVKVYLASRDQILKQNISDVHSLAKVLVNSNVELDIKIVDKIPYSLSGKVKVKELEE